MRAKPPVEPSFDAGAKPGEFALIDTYFSNRARARDDVLLGIGDDAALLRDRPADALRWSSATVRIADAVSTANTLLGHSVWNLLGQGAAPSWATLGLSPMRYDPPWLEAFARTLHDGLDHVDAVLVGGDTTRGAAAVVMFAHGYQVDIPRPNVAQAVQHPWQRARVTVASGDYPRRDLPLEPIPSAAQCELIARCVARARMHGQAVALSPDFASLELALDEPDIHRLREVDVRVLAPTTP